ncbi:MAG: hypothetical protein JXA42_17100 [Anaerolineales bacterium]|nr:hypothetical protein [Anaerolineales bacterium]
MFQTIIDYAGAIGTWLVTLVRFRTVLQSKWNKKVFKSWSLTFWLALFVTFQVDAVYSTVDRLTGVNNLAWLFSYLFLLPAINALCAVFYNHPPQWTRFYLIFSLIALVIVFPFGPGSAPETLDHVRPANIGEILFVGLVYSYVVIMLTAVPMPACSRALKQQRDYDRIRTIAIQMALVITTIDFVIKFSIFAFLSSLPTSVTDIFHRPWAFGIATLWPLGFAPNGFYRAVLRPFRYIKKILTCWELGMLQDRLDRAFPLVVSNEASWAELLRNPDLYIYRRTISILDRRKMLSDKLAQDRPAREWSVLYRGLQNIPKTATLDETASCCQKLYKQMRVI